MLFFFFLVGDLAFAKKFLLDTSHSSIEFSVKHLGIVPVRGRFKVFDGSFDFDPKSGLAKNLVVRVDVDSIDTNEDDRDAHLKSRDFFHVRNEFYNIIEENRYLVFRSKSFSLTSKNMSGDLKILKTIRPVRLKSVISPLKGTHGVEKIGIQAEGVVDRQKFGLTWQKPSTGFLSRVAGKFVGDEVKILVNVLAEMRNNKTTKESKNEK